MKPCIVLSFAIAGCAASPAGPVVVTDHLAMPADLQIANGLLYSIQYDGSIVTTAPTDHSVHTIIPAVRQVAPIEIPVDLDAYNLAVDDSGFGMYWTESAGSQPTVHHANLDGSNPTVLDTGTTPFHALTLISGGACWSSEAAISCAHGTSVAVLTSAIAEPHAMTSYLSTLYVAQPASLERVGNMPVQGDGGLFAVSLTDGTVQTLTLGLDDPRGLVFDDQDRLFWIDSGSRTCTGSSCTSNHDGALHAFELVAPVAGGTVASPPYAAVDDGFAFDAQAVYFVGDARLSYRVTYDALGTGGVNVASPATASCAALAVRGPAIYCAGLTQITQLGQ